MEKLNKRMKPWLMAGAGVAALLIAMPNLVAAQTAEPAATGGDNVVVVTGFRSSLKNALSIKKRSAGTVDSILAEDIAKFPDSNLAESMQRIPGVTLSRGDGGEGRNISVRGLGAQFTRVRINGLEAASQTGSSDIYGAGNSGRSFDFNTFPTEIFSSLAARKTASADVEEGSLGATIDLKAPKPFDYRGNEIFAVNARGSYNELAKEFDPRVSVLASRKWAGGRLGVLASLSYQDRHTREVGYSAVDILSAGLGGNGLGTGAAVQPFCTPLGYAPVSPDPVAQAAKGATAANCSTNNPRTGTLAAYNTILALRSPLAPNTPASGAFFPRIPRFTNSTQHEKRLGGSFTLQYKPDSNTDVSIDYLYSKFENQRRDNYIEPISFARNVGTNGQPMVSVKDIQFDANGSLIYGLFDGVDVRSEGLVDEFTSTFQQVNFNVFHRFSDKFEVSAVLGANQSDWDGTLRLQTFMDAIDTKNFSIDFRDSGDTPVIKFGFDVNNPANFAYGPTAADGTVTGGFSAQGKPQFNSTKDKTLNLDAKYTLTDEINIKFGAQYRQNDFTSFNLNVIPSQVAVKALPAGVTLASLTTTITGVDSLWGNGAPSSWAAIDSGKWRQAFGFDSFQYCGVECGAGRSQIKETIESGYVMGEFNADHWLPVPVRGDVGVRYVHSDQLAVGYIPVAAPAGSTYPTVGKRNEVDRSYADWLPSVNVVLEFTPNLLGRFSAAKVMSRPELGNLTPSSGVNGVTRVGTINNPFLEPIRANTYDASLEWYFKPNSLASVGYFQKDISTFIQRVNSQTPFNQLGLPDSLLDNTGSVPTDIFTVSRLVNTAGGPLKGVELNLQAELDFLPGVFKNLGLLANYTHVTSSIDYALTSANGAITSSVNADLIGLSRDSASSTLYYEDDRFSVRTTGTYRGKFIRGIPASTGSDLQGNSPTFYMDASFSYNVSPHLKLTLEAQNLTDEENRLYIDSVREDTLFNMRIGRTISVALNYKY